MILDVREKAQAHLFPCRIFDADGKEILFAVRADTVTGVVVKRALTKSGVFYEDLLSKRRWDGSHYVRDAKTETVRHPAPLRIAVGMPTFK